jgi:hypothetical protein
LRRLRSIAQNPRLAAKSVLTTDAAALRGQDAAMFPLSKAFRDKKEERI